ncbi:MAG: hypothetical protein OER86_04385, partial [Phycisphaerae bacterium]|nr:hypothetical protein [Phycisphaerae bacterium]
GLIPVIIAAVVIAARQVPRPATVRALLDRHGDCGGLLMADEETDLGAWSQRVPSVAAPTVRWRGGRAGGGFLLALAFLLVGFLVPQRLMNVTKASPLEIDDQLGHIAEQIDALEEEKIISEQEAEEFGETLEQVRDEARADDPIKTFEALDNLEKTLAEAAEKAAEETIAQTEKLSEAETLAEGLEEDQSRKSPELDQDGTGEAMAQLAKMLESLMAQNEAFRQMMTANNLDPGQLPDFAPPQPKKPKQVFLNKNLDPEKLKEITEALKNMNIDPKQAGLLDKKMLEKLKEAVGPDGRVDPEKFKQVEKALKEAGLRDNKLPPLNEQQLQQVRDLLKQAGVNEEDFALIDPDQAEAMQQQMAPPGGEPMQLTPEQMKQLQKMAAACEAGKGELAEGLKRLVDAGLLDPKALGECRAAGKCDGKGLAKFLAWNGKAGSCAALVAAWCAGNKPGRGGITRGRGDAPLTWKDPSSEQGVKFKEQVLPPSDFSAMKQSQLVGVSVGAPKLAERVEAGSSVALRRAAAAGGSAAKQTVLPRHRAAVERYFDRK